MSIYNATSWGEHQKTQSTTQSKTKTQLQVTTLLALNQLSEAEFTDANGCYRTENQRYMHLMCSNRFEYCY